jgi:hypothetical protein
MALYVNGEPTMPIYDKRTGEAHIFVAVLDAFLINKN